MTDAYPFGYTKWTKPPKNHISVPIYQAFLDERLNRPKRNRRSPIPVHDDWAEVEGILIYYDSCNRRVKQQVKGTLVGKIKQN